MFRTLLLVGWLSCLLTRIGYAENWPGWRGPRGDGTSESVHLPRTWDGTQGKHIAWSTELPGEGHSSPIVWENHVFVTTCIPQSQDRMLLCLDSRNGNLRWKVKVLQALLESKHALNSYASSTPCTDGETVFVTFFDGHDTTVPAPNVGDGRPIHPGQIVVAAFDYQGRRRWIVRPGGFLSAHGFASNPVLFGDLVIVNGDHDGDSYIVALDKSTGNIVWKSQRRHRTRSYATPIIRQVAGKHQLVLSGSQHVAALSPRDGRPIWHVEGPTEQFVASMVFDGHRFFAVGGYPTHHVVAVDPSGSGDVTNTHVAWHVTNVRSYVPSPVIVGDFLLVADDRGTANCFATQSGKRIWQTRMGKHYSASLVTAGGLVYFVADDGVTKVLLPDIEPRVLATNHLGENTYASPAIADDAIYLRGERHLFRISHATP